MESDNDMLVLVRKGRPDSICDFVSDSFAMFIVKNDSGERMWWRVSYENGAKFHMYSINISTAEEGS